MRHIKIVVLMLCVTAIGTGSAQTQNPLDRITEADL